MAYRDEVLADSPIAYWPLDDAGTTAADVPNVAEVVANRVMTNGGNVPGQTSLLPNGSGKAFHFPGGGGASGSTDPKMQRANEAALRPSSFTVEVWVSPSNVNAGGYRGALVGFESSTAGWVLHTYGPNIRVVTYSGAGAAIALTGTATMTVGGKYHVAMTYNAGVITTYLNGVQDATVSSKTITQQSVNSFRVGSNHGGGGDTTFAYDITADLDEVAYYGTALSATRIKAHYDAAVATPSTPSGSINATLPALTGTFAATVTDPPPPGGTLDATLPALTGTFAGTGHLTAWRDHVVQTNPVMWWDFEAIADGSYGATGARPADVSGHGLDATNAIQGSLIDALIPGDAGGKGLKATSNWPSIQTADTRVMGAAGATAFTARWPAAPYNVANSTQYLIDRNDGQIWVMPSSNNTLRLNAGSAQIDTGITHAEVFDAKKHLFVLTWDATDTRLYLDGTLRATAAGTPGPPTANSTWTWGLATVQSDPREYDDVVFWDHKLTAADVTGLKNAWDLQLNAVLPALTGSFAGTTAKPVITGTADVTLPTLGASFAATAAVPTVDVSLDATLPGLAATFAGSSVAPGVVGGTIDVTLPALAGSFSSSVAVVGTFADNLPALVGAFDGTTALPPEVATVDTFDKSNGRRRTGISYATVTYDPVTPPPHIVPVPVRIMAQQIGAP